ncbi:MAG: DUF1559 domain-containing protein [Planctomycetaceae bacterium]|nr:DUF1559 domain-containing protein [Planctomycetaceae bacterium]
MVVVLLFVSGIFFPFLCASRERSRRMACEAKLKTLGEAIKQYESVNQKLPCHKHGPKSANRISAFTDLLPHLNYENIYKEINDSNWQVPWRKEKTDANGKPILDTNQKQIPSPYCNHIQEFLCPSDQIGVAKPPFMFGLNNYVFSHGDWVVGTREKFSRGVFVPDNWRKFDDVIDGLSSTLCMSERVIASEIGRQIKNQNAPKSAIKETPNQINIRGGVRLDMKEPVSENTSKQNFQLCFDTAKDGQFIDDNSTLKINTTWTGTRWADGQHFFTTTNTIIPPNGPSCAATSNDESPLLAPPTSYHTNGVNALFLDGQVKFISNNIDYGKNYTNKQCTKEGISPFGVWGSLGNIADSKIIQN